MVLYASAMDDEPESHIIFKPIYNEEVQNEFLLFDFEVGYTRTPQVDSDGEEEDFSNLETRTVSSTYNIRKALFIGGDKNLIEDIVYSILESIEVPCYSDIVWRITLEIWKLMECDATLRNVEKIEITLDVFADIFPGEEEEIDMVVVDMVVDGDVDVRPAVAPASDEAVEAHLETVVVETEGYCVICLDEILVGAGGEASRMPCQHVFHRTCGEEWLRNSGVCPMCRSVFPA